MKTRGRILLAAALAIFVLALPAQALAAIKIHKINFDPPGADNGSNASLNAETITIKNTGSARVGIGGWTIRDTSGHVYRFGAGYRIGAGAKATLHTATAANRFGHVYWRQDNYVWNNDGTPQGSGSPAVPWRTPAPTRAREAQSSASQRSQIGQPTEGNGHECCHSDTPRLRDAAHKEAYESW